MLSAEEANRRAALAAIGLIQILLGCTALSGIMAVIMVKLCADSASSGTWSIVFYILLGMVAAQFARLDIEAPSRGELVACIIINSIVAVQSILAAALLMLGLTELSCVNSGASSHCREFVMILTKASLGISIINLSAAIPFSIAAAVFATKIKNAATPMTFATQLT